jgi:hypothetical protein
MPTPKYKITNFTKDNVHWLKGMLPVSLGGSQVLTNGNSTSNNTLNVASFSESEEVASTFVPQIIII